MPRTKRRWGPYITQRITVAVCILSGDCWGYKDRVIVWGRDLTGEGSGPLTEGERAVRVSLVSLFFFSFPRLVRLSLFAHSGAYLSGGEIVVSQVVKANRG